jgi:integrase
VRQQLLGRGLSRHHINKQIGRVRRIWRWGVEHELVAAGVLASLEAVAPLKRGRTSAPEEAPIQPVILDVVEATLPYLSANRRALVLLQLHSGMRAEAAVCMRPCDVDVSGQLWAYRPAEEGQKKAHLGQLQTIYLGPKAQDAIRPLLNARKREQWLFPSAGVGIRRGTRGHLTVSGYQQAVARAVKRANRVRAKLGLAPLAHWFPLQLRHTALTLIRERFGVEAAQAVGGHAEVTVTQIYAQRSEELARRIASQMG